MRTRLALTTAPRPNGASYLPDTLAQLRRQGVGGLSPALKLLLSDGPLAAPPPPGWTVETLDPAQGSRASLHRALLWGARHKGDDLLLLEDDLLLAPGALQRLLACPVPDTAAVLSFFDEGAAPNHPPGLALRPLGPTHPLLRGSLALKVPARALPLLLRHWPHNHLFPNLHCRDAALGLAASTSPWPQVATLFPNPVQHAGLTSAVRGPRAALPRRTRNFG